MTGLDIIGATPWRLDTPVTTPPARCPICAGPIAERCKCAIGDAKCTRGHEWHRCRVHNRTLQGPGDHSLGAERCQCHRSLTIGHARGPDCPPLTHCTEIVGAVEHVARDLAAIKPVTVSVAGAILRAGMRAIDAARTVAAVKGLPGGGKRDECFWKLQWHKDALAKLAATPNTLYGAESDLRKWTAQAFSEWNAVETGAGIVDAAAADLWSDIKANLASLPKDVIDAANKGITTLQWIIGGIAVIVVAALGIVFVGKVRR